jgi:alpha-galactosidase/6-phospho-beta-glucosidase family protein
MSESIEKHNSPMNRREMLKTAGLTAGGLGLFGSSLASLPSAGNKMVDRPGKKIKIGFIGGGSQTWAPYIIRDIVNKPELGNVEMEIALVEIHMGRAKAIEALFKVKFEEWGVADRVRVYPTLDPVEGLSDANFIIIAISTGRLPAMSQDLSIPEKYRIYQCVGDTSGPGGWARNLRNFPVFADYAKLIKEVAPQAFVLNYTNPLAALTKVLANELGTERVVGLCHGLFECYDVIGRMFGVKEEQIRVRFGGVNHFFWILDFKIDGQDGYAMLDEKLNSGGDELINSPNYDPFGDGTNKKLLTMELYKHFGYMPYVGDRHTCEFFSAYITDTEMMDRFKLVRTFIPEREENYVQAAKNIENWTKNPGGLDRVPSRESAADMMNAIIYDEPYMDVVNLVNQGQIANLPLGAVVETLGIVDSRGFAPFAIGPLPDQIRTLVEPHADVQLRLVDAYQKGDVEEALFALAADPVCAYLTISDIKKMGAELLAAHKKFLPDFQV